VSAWREHHEFLYTHILPEKYRRPSAVSPQHKILNTPPAGSEILVLVSSTARSARHPNDLVTRSVIPRLRGEMLNDT
jgi:hypothetical protein